MSRMNLKPLPYPTQVKRITRESTSDTSTDAIESSGSGLCVTWSTGETTVLSSTLLRISCPCATCEEKRGARSHEKPLSTRKTALRVLAADLSQELDLKEIWSIGNYAIGIRWGDNHDTGIYSYEVLRELASKSESG